MERSSPEDRFDVSSSEEDLPDHRHVDRGRITCHISGDETDESTSVFRKVTKEWPATCGVKGVTHLVDVRAAAISGVATSQKRISTIIYLALELTIFESGAVETTETGTGEERPHEW